MGAAVAGDEDRAAVATPAVSGVAEYTLERRLVTPDFCALQWAPPSLVARIVPPSPTAQPWHVDECTLERFVEVPSSGPARRCVGGGENRAAIADAQP